MLVNSKEILNNAKNQKYAVPHFNINNLEWTKYILETCEEMKSPVILGVSESTIKHMGGYNTVINIVKALIKDLNITIPTCIHLDHGSSIQNCIDAINAGFTSVMIDASKYDLNKNINITKKVVEYAKKYNVSVEAELGYIGKSVDTLNNNIYPKIDDVIQLVEKTNIDSIAPALGNIHGLYREKPHLDFIRMKKISNKINIPLVLHGGSGIYDSQITTAIENGISKININTELQITWSNAVREFLIQNPYIYDPRRIIESGKIAMQNKIKEKIILFGSNNKY